MSDEKPLLGYLSAIELRVLGPLARRLLDPENPRVRRAIETTGPQATARMGCVNALRVYAIALFVLGTVLRLLGVSPAAVAVYVLAAACMAWSFWCLYTVAAREREFKRRDASAHPRGT